MLYNLLHIWALNVARLPPQEMCGLHKNAGKLTSRTIKSLLLRNPIFIAILEKGGVGREIVELLSTRISANNLILFPLKWLLSSFIVSLFHKIVALSCCN